MPSLLHEGIIELIRDRPEVAPKLLSELLHVEVPQFSEARLAEANLTQLLPVEYRADAVVLLVDGKPVFGIVIEAQLQPDERKFFSWPVYAVTARARYECPCVVIVITPESDLADWASKWIDLGGGMQWRPLVVGPEGIPVITDPQQASRVPELAVLSAMAHGRGSPEVAVAIALAAVEGMAGLPEEPRVLYCAFIESALSDAARKAIQMPLAEKFFSETQRHAFARGKAEGKTEGKAEGQAQFVIRVLVNRGLSISEAQRERILTCHDTEQLTRWLDAALSCGSVDELLH
ncbi:MAG TPA: hypothetical protein VFQ61_27100 [Polyangiaceae bacterium]|nr:hypothetical protein [Polyangiaceae bacterium]